MGGSVWMFWGRKELGLDHDFYDTFSQFHEKIPGTSLEHDSFGHALAAGDFTGDGIDDLAIGDPREFNPARGVKTGTVVVVPGGPGPGEFTLDGSQQLWGWAQEEAYEVEYQGFGWSLAAVEHVSSKGTELVVGAPFTKVRYPDQVQERCTSSWSCGTGEKPGNGQAGRVYVFCNQGGLIGTRLSTRSP